jgi:alpha-L-rhamnosidase
MGTNAVASVIDGAKRGRYCWSGDLAVAGPLIYYTNAHSEFVKGMMELLGSFHRSNPNNKGEVSTTLAPSSNPGSQPATTCRAAIPRG